MSKKNNSSKDSSTATEALDYCFIFTLIQRKQDWATRVAKTKKGNRNVLDILVGMMDGTRSIITFWGNGTDDCLITLAFSWFR